MVIKLYEAVKKGEVRGPYKNGQYKNKAVSKYGKYKYTNENEEDIRYTADIFLDELEDAKVTYYATWNNRDYNYYISGKINGTKRKRTQEVFDKYKDFVVPLIEEKEKEGLVYFYFNLPGEVRT